MFGLDKRTSATILTIVLAAMALLATGCVSQDVVDEVRRSCFT